MEKKETMEKVTDKPVVAGTKSKNEKPPVMVTKTVNEMTITVEGEEGRMYRFAMPFFSPLPECYAASINVSNEIARLFNEAVEKQKEEKAKKDKEEEAK